MLNVVTEDTEAFIEAFFGRPQHDAHMKNWRWHQFTGGPAGYAARDAAVDKALAELIYMRRSEARARSWA